MVSFSVSSFLSPFFYLSHHSGPLRGHEKRSSFYWSPFKKFDWILIIGIQTNNFKKKLLLTANWLALVDFIFILTNMACFSAAIMKICRFLSKSQQTVCKRGRTMLLLIFGVYRVYFSSNNAVLLIGQACRCFRGYRILYSCCLPLCE